MSAILAGGVAGAYVVAVVGLHRLNVRRMRRQAGGFPTLSWIDWDTLFEGLLPGTKGAARPGRAHGGGPMPRLPDGGDARAELLAALASGAGVDDERIAAAGFSGGQVEWLKILRLAVADPRTAHERLQTAALGTAPELYLLEHLKLRHGTHAVNLEWSVFSAKRRLTQGLARYGEHPALFYARALASSLIGFNHAAIDDLARAVYFSRQAPLYLSAVIDTPFIEEARPALAQQCKLALDGH